ncbi:MAG TPA: TauD/TfdA family dioxygenase [Burkholderiales bacterium]|nr:TauD/TfdA family dioxygenase [Burkholderiales bacterium]
MLLAQEHKEQEPKPIEAPCTWNGADMQNRTDWLRPFSAVELAEIDAALHSVKQRGLELFDIGKADFALPGLSRELAKISQELESGRGMIMLRGLPLTYTPDDLRTVYWGMGTHLGTAVSQNKTGEMLGVVKDFGGPVVNTTRRGSKTAHRLQFHSDRCDVVGLLCVRKAMSGGASRIVSAVTLHNEIARRRPDLIGLFYDNWDHSWQGEQPPGSGRTNQRPIFSMRDGCFSGLFSPAYIWFAQDFPEVPRHTPAQVEALKLFDELADELALDMHFEPGDIQLLNNHVIYHGRTSFVDYAEPERKRVLLRLWLSVPGSRPLAPIYKEVFGGVERGELRGGVPCQEGWWRDLTQFRKHRTGIHATQGLSW